VCLSIVKLRLLGVREVEESEARVQLRDRGEYITKAIDRGDSEEIDGRGNCDNALLTEGES